MKDFPFKDDDFVLRPNVAKNLFNLYGLYKKKEEQQFNWAQFLILILIAIYFTFSAILYLPILVLFPSQFAFNFTLGQLFFLCSLGYYKGFENLYQDLFKKERKFISFFYIFSVIGTLFTSIQIKSYLIMVICCVLQVKLFKKTLSLLWMIASSFQNGKQTMKSCQDWCLKSLKNTFFRMIGKKQNFLPL